MTGKIETLYAGKWLTVRRQGKWEFVSRTGGVEAVVILAIDDGHVLLIDQYRVPLGKRCIELPVGLIGDEHAGDTALDAGRRELEEETGYTCETVEEIGFFHASPGMVTEGFTLVRVTGLTKIGEGGGIDGEDIVVHRVPLAEVPAFIAAKRAEGAAVDVKVLLLLAETILSA
ncbi:MAG: NUDIX hydrolase [Pseudomonadota bacterium]